MEKQFEILKANRLIILKIIEDLSLKQLNKIPEGFRNNIAWNVAHLPVIQQLLCYKLSGLPINVNDESDDMTQQELETIKDLYVKQIAQFKEDYHNNKFTAYNTYPTSANVTLHTINDAIAFNNFHEGLHLGYILALKNTL